MKMDLYFVMDDAHNQYFYLVKDYLSLDEAFQRDQKVRKMSQTIWSSQKIGEINIPKNVLEGILSADFRNSLFGGVDIRLRVEPRACA